MPPPPAGFGPAPSPLALMVPVHAAPIRTAKASPARPHARCCAARVPTSRREHDDGSLVQLTSLSLSKESARCSTSGNRETSGRERHAGSWSEVVPWSAISRSMGNWETRRLFVNFVVRIRAGRFPDKSRTQKATRSVSVAWKDRPPKLVDRAATMARSAGKPERSQVQMVG